MGKWFFYRNQDISAPHEAGLLRLNINKAMNELGWKPEMEL